MTSTNTLRLGTRGSALALVQAEIVKADLQQKYGDHLNIEIVVISTRGDEKLNLSLSDNHLSKGLFTLELEKSLLDGSIDFAVHSLKDMPVDNTFGTEIAAFLPRADVSDVLLSTQFGSIEELPLGAIVGTSSPRRCALLRHLYPQKRFEYQSIRGNVGTRLQKLADGKYDAILMAKAGLDRLGFEAPIIEIIPPLELLPAPGQGIIAVQIASERKEIKEIALQINSTESEIAARVERSLLKVLGGGCAMAFGAYCRIESNENNLWAVDAFYSDDINSIRLSELFNLQDEAAIIRTMGEKMLNCCVK